MKRPVVTVSEAPEDTPVTLAELKADLRVDWDDEDDVIQAYLDAAVEVLDVAKKKRGKKKGFDLLYPFHLQFSQLLPALQSSEGETRAGWWWCWCSVLRSCLITL